MLVVVSPAKRLDWADPGLSMQTPRFAADAAHLAGVARKLSKAKLQALMGISADLAKLNQRRFHDFVTDPAPETTRPAAWAFAGDTYQGLEIASLDGDARHWADGHLRILSGLYGLLRPRDAIQPYRLEMGSKLKTRRAGDLYGYWGDRIAAALAADAGAVSADWLLNCASQEYFGAVDTAALGLPVIAPVFLEERDGEAKIVSFYAKKARGAMARFVMERRITDPAGLRDFDTGGYRFDPGRSTDAAPVFLRSSEANSRAA